jgi:hypothetical protein
VILVELPHDLPMAFDEAFHEIALVEEFIPVHRFELDGISISRGSNLGDAAAEIPGIVMQGETIDAGTIRGALSSDFFEKGTSPIPVVVVWPGRDQLQFLSIGGNQVP